MEVNWWSNIFCTITSCLLLPSCNTHIVGNLPRVERCSSCIYTATALTKISQIRHTRITLTNAVYSSKSIYSISGLWKTVEGTKTAAASTHLSWQFVPTVLGWYRKSQQFTAGLCTVNRKKTLLLEIVCESYQTSFELTDVDKKNTIQETRREVTVPCIFIHMSVGTDILRATHGKETFVPPLGSRYF